MGQANSLPPETKEFNVVSFLRSAKEGNVDKLLWCLQCRGSDVNATNQICSTALHIAAKEGHVDFIRELLHRNADYTKVTRMGNTAMHIAAMHGQREVVRVLAEQGASANVTCMHGYTPLYVAVMEKHADVVETLLGYGADPAITPDVRTQREANDPQCSAMCIAQIQKQDNIVRMLKHSDIEEIT